MKPFKLADPFLPGEMLTGVTTHSCSAGSFSWPLSTGFFE